MSAIKLLSACLICAFVLGGCAPARPSQRQSPAEELGPLEPYSNFGQRDSLCAQPDERLKAQDELTLQALALFRRGEAMSLAAESNFLRPRPFNGKFACPSTNLFPRLARVLLDNGYYDRREPQFPNYASDNELGLARLIGPVDPRIVESVANTAYYDPLVPSEILRRDIRPLARTVLAEFGPPHSTPFAARAYNEMSTDDAFGTASAQLAVASRYKDALSKTERMMSFLLAQHPIDPIPKEAEKRLYELADALAFAGPEARSHFSPVYALLKRKVIGAYGMHVSPTQPCRLLPVIGGDEAETWLRTPPCDEASSRTGPFTGPSTPSVRPK